MWRPGTWSILRWPFCEVARPPRPQAPHLKLSGDEPLQVGASCGLVAAEKRAGQSLLASSDPLSVCFRHANIADTHTTERTTQEQTPKANEQTKQNEKKDGVALEDVVRPARRFVTRVASSARQTRDACDRVFITPVVATAAPDIGVVTVRDRGSSSLICRRHLQFCCG